MAVVLSTALPTVGAAAALNLRATSVVRADTGSGKLVRRVVAPTTVRGGSGGSLRQAARVDELIRKAADKYGVDPLLVHSVIEVESNYDPFAVSPKGAEGLMQLTPQTASRFGVRNSFVPFANIDGGVRYLKYLQDLFQDNRLALAAYNAGEGAVARHRRVPPYRETREYVEKVRARYEELRRKQGAASAVAGGTSEPEPPLEVSVDSYGRLHLSNVQTR